VFYVLAKHNDDDLLQWAISISDTSHFRSGLSGRSDMNLDLSLYLLHLHPTEDLSYYHLEFASAYVAKCFVKVVSNTSGGTEALQQFLAPSQCDAVLRDIDHHYSALREQLREAMTDSDQ
jgi:hypothetical protein